jgi:hypothetical protein
MTGNDNITPARLKTGYLNLAVRSIHWNHSLWEIDSNMEIAIVRPHLGMAGIEHTTKAARAWAIEHVSGIYTNMATGWVLAFPQRESRKPSNT